ncbi:coiled-coil domain-containing protein 107 isoform X2 [Scyliorhinus canicula]|uniref:coiled-coil domain-containing protein 107 isoform X2 n=1 Tax=Scyliorhinus canicula TaxID=7830 RepID=UPI0018F7941C|nr:coiled-coil domain-containing protein 107 isoform X2 [Scyliorhinus canicula]
MSLGQQAALALGLFLCVFVLVPKLFPWGAGGEREAAARSAAHRPAVPGRGQHLLRHTQSNSPKGPPNLRMRSINQKEMSGEKTPDRNKGFAFQLMPLYAIGISIYAVYKLVQVKFNENERRSDEKNKEVDKKRKNTETQLSELETRLAQTERMLDSLVKELDPLTSCVDAVASEQKNEIMTQLLQLRQLVKERQAPTIDELTLVSENLKECVQGIEIKAQVSEDQASTDSEQDSLDNIDPITGNPRASSFFDEIESGSSISTEDTEGDSETVAVLSETQEPMKLRRRIK